MTTPAWPATATAARATGQRATRPLSRARTRGGRPRSWGASAWSGCSARTSPRSPAAARPAGSAIIGLIIQTIRRVPSRSGGTDEAPDPSSPDPSGADQSGAEHQATDLAVGGLNPSRRARSLRSAAWAVADFEQLVAAHGAVLPRPGRADEPRRVGSLGRWRRWIESTFDPLKGQLGLERHGGRTLPGVVVWVAQRLAWPRRSGGTGRRRARQALPGRLRPLGPHPPAGRPARRGGGRDPR
jgi:hypothetical protein